MPISQHTTIQYATTLIAIVSELPELNCAFIYQLRLYTYAFPSLRWTDTWGVCLGVKSQQE